MQLLGNLFEQVLEKQDRHLNVLGATSGDTGSAAEHALKGKARVNVFMLSPHGRMSPFQRAQMYSLQDRQHLQHRDRRHVRRLPGRGEGGQPGPGLQGRRHAMGAVNSINWARVVAQVVYYFKGYFAATRSNDEQVSFAVPSGNFGNIFAGYVAKRMGLPIRRLVLATNENDVLDEFFRTGRYRPRKAAETHATSSPSMDISKASNFERFIWDAVDRTATRSRGSGSSWTRRAASTCPPTARGRRSRTTAGFVSGRSTHEDRIDDDPPREGALRRGDRSRTPPTA